MGESGKPYRSPRDAWKKFSAHQFPNGAIQGDLIQAWIHLMKGGSKPNICISWNRKSYLTLSKAFAKSSFMTIHFSRCLMLEWIASWTKIILSAMCLPLTKPPWFSGMIAGSTALILFSITLAIILYPILHKEMGMNLSKEVTPFSLGMRERKAELVLPPILSQP